MSELPKKPELQEKTQEFLDVIQKMVENKKLQEKNAKLQEMGDEELKKTGNVYQTAVAVLKNANNPAMKSIQDDLEKYVAENITKVVAEEAAEEESTEPAKTEESTEEAGEESKKEETSTESTEPTVAEEKEEETTEEEAKEEEKTEEPAAEESTEEKETTSEKKGSINLPDLNTPFGLIKRNTTITRADKELHDGLTEALMQKNKIVAPEASYHIDSIYQFENDKGEQVKNVDITLPVREGVRDKEIVERISLDEMEAEMIPQTIMVDGMAVSKNMELPARLRNSINVISKKKNLTRANSWTVTNIVRASESGDILFELKNEHGETYHVNPDFLEKVTFEHRINKLQQDTVLGEKTAKDVEEFLNSRFKFPDGPAKIDPGFSIELDEEEVKPKIETPDEDKPEDEGVEKETETEVEKGEPKKTEETAEEPAADETKEEETSTESTEPVATEGAVETAATKEEGAVSAEEGSDEEFAKRLKEKLGDKLKLGENTEKKPEASFSKENLQKGLQEVLAQPKVYPGAIVTIPEGTERLTIAIKYPLGKDTVDAVINLPNSDTAIEITPENITAAIMHTEKPGMFNRVMGEKDQVTNITTGEKVTQEKRTLSSILTKAFNGILKRNEMSPDTHVLKVKDGKLAVYSK